MKQIGPGHKRQHGVNYYTLSEGEVIRVEIPEDAVVNPNIGGNRALVFEKELKTKGGKETHRFRFTCFSDSARPGDRVVCRLKLGNRQVKGNRKMTMYARLDVVEAQPTAELRIIDDQERFETTRGEIGVQSFPFPRDNQPGGALLLPVTSH